MSQDKLTQGEINKLMAIDTHNELEHIHPVISKETDAWENTPMGFLSSLYASMIDGKVLPKEMVVLYYDRINGKKILKIKALGAQRDRLIGMLDLAKIKMILDELGE